MNKDLKNIVTEYEKTINMYFVNSIVNTSDESDFALNKSTLMNIAEWALNGSSDEEIRKKLDLRPKQWGILLSICPSLVLVMQHSRALADTVIAGSLFQTAIGGKRIKKQVPVRIREYDENGKVCGEHYDKIEVEEELPPNPILLKFLAEHKLSDKFGDKPVDSNSQYRDILNSLTPEQIALIESTKKKGALNDN